MTRQRNLRTFWKLGVLRAARLLAIVSLAASKTALLTRSEHAHGTGSLRTKTVRSNEGCSTALVYIKVLVSRSYAG